MLRLWLIESSSKLWDYACDMWVRQHAGRSTVTRLFFIITIFLAGILPGVVGSAYAQVVPDSITGPADVNRVSPQMSQPALRPDAKAMVDTGNLPSTVIPDGVEKIHLILKDIEFVGVSAFSEAQLRPLYAAYVDKDITLDKVYKIADALTRMYRDHGYFLSVAYVPDQKISGGTINIAAIEGHISDVEIQGDAKSGRVLSQYIGRVKTYKPVTANQVESFLLRINDLPGEDYRAVLAPMPEGAIGATKLILVASAEKGQGTISYDNFSSRYLGPHELSLFYSKSFIPLTMTSISLSGSLPMDELKYVTLMQSFVVAPNVKVSVGGNVTHSAPGFTLKPLDTKSNSRELNVGVEWQPVRQRDQNLVFGFKFERRDTETDLLYRPFSRDHIRVARLSANFDTVDFIGGYDIGEVIISHGISGLGASNRGDPDMSRPQAVPDFSKIEARISHLQDIGHSLVVSLTGAGQWASGPLYSSEEFGYGGQTFGRAYDASEITGDNGIAGAMELQYNGFDTETIFNVRPYVFYDIGQVWNDDVGQVKKASGASAGFGFRGEVMNATSYNLGFAYPLTREIGTPIQGGGSNDPRMYIQLNQNF